MALPRKPVPANQLAVAGIVLAVLFAVLAAIPTSRWIVLAFAVAALVGVAFLMREVICDQWGLRKENTERERFRGTLRIVPNEIAVAELSDVYGFEVMNSIKGLQDGRARLKPTEAGPGSEPYTP